MLVILVRPETEENHAKLISSILKGVNNHNSDLSFWASLYRPRVSKKPEFYICHHPSSVVKGWRSLSYLYYRQHLTASGGLSYRLRYTELLERFSRTAQPLLVPPPTTQSHPPQPRPCPTSPLPPTRPSFPGRTPCIQLKGLGIAISSSSGSGRSPPTKRSLLHLELKKLCQTTLLQLDFNCTKEIIVCLQLHKFI